MAEIKARLKEQSENCLQAYTAWSENKKDTKAREGLREAIHELRKVSSRLEIGLAVNERDEMAKRPIPVPPHRDAKRRGNEEIKDGPQEFSDQDTEMQKAPPVKRRNPRRRSRSADGGNS